MVQSVLKKERILLFLFDHYQPQHFNPMNRHKCILAHFFNLEGIKCAEYSHLDYKAQDAVRNLVQEDEYWEGWEYEGVLDFSLNGKSFQVVKSMNQF
jgi:hypothetical protein